MKCFITPQEHTLALEEYLAGFFIGLNAFMTDINWYNECSIIFPLVTGERSNVSASLLHYIKKLDSQKWMLEQFPVLVQGHYVLCCLERL